MPAIATVVVAASVALLLIGIIWRQYRSPKWSILLFNLLGLAAYVLLLRLLFGFPNLEGPQPKGGEQTQFPALVLAMYVCMVAGMVAEYLYHYVDSAPSKRRKFNWGAFFKPFLVSPLVFMPLAASLQNANLDFTRLDPPRLMIFLVAFENGFLWRGYFSRKMAESESAKAAAQGKQS